MIGHQAINMDDHVEFIMSSPQAIEKEITVIIGEKNGLFLITS